MVAHPHPPQPCSDTVLQNGARIGRTPGRVTPLEETYHVLGDRNIVYKVTVIDGGRRARCTCPVSVICKHIVAVADHRARHGALGRPAAA